jgi:hypothetical protein
MRSLVTAAAGTLSLAAGGFRRRLRRRVLLATEATGGVSVELRVAPVEAIELREQARRASWGWFPQLSLVTALGVLVMAVADATSRAALGFRYSEPLFWLAIVVIVAPIAYRVSSTLPGSGERLALVALASLALFVVKALRDPFLFTYPDELVHVTNANAVLDGETLFTANNILPATPAYPGLPVATAALATLTGLSTFGAGLIVIGAARLVITLALFLLFREVTASSRVGALAALVYAGNPNYLFFSAQFAYESLALPLAVTGLYCVTRWMRGHESRDGAGLLLCAAVLAFAVVTTHHVTSFAMLAALLGLTVAQLFVDKHRGLVLGGLSSVVAVVTLLWLKVVAGETATYLGGIFGRAAAAIESTLAREEGARKLLGSGNQGPPIWDRALAYAWVLTLVAAIALGLLQMRRRYRGNIVATGLALAALLYLGILPLRLVSGAWELANRSSEFLFVGVALLVAIACVNLVRFVRLPHLSSALTALLVVVVVAGGTLGWPRSLRTAQTLRISAGEATLEPRALTAVRWVESKLGRNQIFAASDVSARLLASVAHEQVYTGFTPVDIYDVITMPTKRLPKWALENLKETRAGYLFIDRQDGPGDKLRAQYFVTSTSEARDVTSLDALLKFDRQPGTDRIYDGGTIKIYDIRRMQYASGRR